MQLQGNVDEKGGKYTEATAEVYLAPSESILLRSQSCIWLGRGVLELNLHEECNFNAILTRREASTPRRQPEPGAGSRHLAPKFSGAKCSVPGDMKGVGKWGIPDKDF